MNRIKHSLAAFGGLSVVIGLIALATPRASRGQSGNQQPLRVDVVNTAPTPSPSPGR